jgi:RNA ligase (TIGR02306 family)
MERKLASIQVITDIQPIPGADAIEVASILGWKVVVKKGEFRVGDWCVYTEIDSILPDRPEFEFMRKSHFRVRTIKLRGQISQGIAFPTGILPEATSQVILGQDVTEVLNITKYEPEVVANCDGLTFGNFPSFIPKTDETRLQSALGVLNEIKGQPLCVTTKIDGTSATYYCTAEHFGLCSRSRELKPTDGNSYFELTKKYDLENKMRKLMETIGAFAIQGEIAGPGLQKNRLGLKEPEFFAFNAYSIQNGHYYNAEEFLNICEVLGVKTVPIVALNLQIDTNLEGWLNMADLHGYPNGSPAEGIIVRPMKEQRSETLGGRLSFKVVSNKFLLKNVEA